MKAVDRKAKPVARDHPEFDADNSDGSYLNKGYTCSQCLQGL
jgi:hypothetical protein